MPEFYSEDNQTNKSEDLISSEEIKHIQQTEEIENMEVHHHAHDPAAPHHKKNWKNYFWEFLMLFLAVFCGFLAEYQLEHKIERDRAAEVAGSFYAELKVDSAAVKSATRYSIRKDSALNYLKHYLRDSSLTNVSKEFAINYCYGFMINSTAIFEPRAAILDLLINSGSLRYFKSKKLQKLSIDLSIAIKELKSRNERIKGHITINLDPFTLKHLDDDGYNKIAEFKGLEVYRKSNVVIPFRFYNPEKVDKVEDINRIGIYARLTRQNVSKFYKDYDVINKKLLIELRKEYRLN